MSSVKLPKGRTLADEYARTLTAQAGVMPNILGAQAQYQPLQASNQLSNLNMLLMGAPEMDYQTQEYVPAVYRQGKEYSYGKIPTALQGTIQYPPLPDATTLGGSKGGGGISGGGMQNKNVALAVGSGGGSFAADVLMGKDPFGGLLGGGKSKPPKRLIAPSRYITTPHHAGAQRGLLDIYTKDVLPTLSGGIIPQLTDQANYELGLGGMMDPAMMRQAMQGVRSRQAGMLGGTGTAGDLNEALGLSAFGNQLLDRRRAFAANVAAMRMGSNPVSQALGIPAGALGFLNPESGYAGDLYNTNYNAKVGAGLANAKMTNDLIGAGIGAVGSLGGGALGAFM